MTWFVRELVIWPKEVTLVTRTQPSDPLCLWQCLDCQFEWEIWFQQITWPKCPPVLRWHFFVFLAGFITLETCRNWKVPPWAHLNQNLPQPSTSPKPKILQNANTKKNRLILFTSSHSLQPVKDGFGVQPDFPIESQLKSVKGPVIKFLKSNPNRGG